MYENSRNFRLSSWIGTYTDGGKSFRKSCAKLGYEVKIEQQGSLGQVNEITAAEAKEADFLLLATDQKVVGMERFEGKPQIRVNINTCIKAPEAVLKKCVAAVEQRNAN